MKKILVILGISLAIAACGGKKGGEDKADSTSSSNNTAVSAETNAAQDTSINKIGTDKTAGGGGTPTSKGAKLIADSDCGTCHQEQAKVIGPAFAEIAKKYKSSDEDMLAKKIISGGSGNWGSVPMTAHPDLAENDAREMVKYILSVK